MNIEEGYRILDLAPGESLEKVDASVRLLVKVWNPERFAHHPKLYARAQEKLKEIQAAQILLAGYLTPVQDPHRQSVSVPASAKQAEARMAGEPELEVERKRQEAERREQEKERIRQERARQQDERHQRDRDAALQRARLEKAQRKQKEIQKREQRETAQFNAKKTERRQFAMKVVLAIILIALVALLWLI